MNLKIMEIWRQLQNPSRRVVVVIGAILVQLTFGTLFTAGNLSPYVISYLRQHNEPSITNNQVVWIAALQGGCLGIGMPIGGILERKIGPRYAGLLGSAIMSLGTAITYFTIHTTYPYVLLTYGIIFGSGSGLGYIAMIAVGMKWYPKNSGLVNGITLGAFGLGSLVFNPLQTTFINPKNIPPNEDRYFTNETLLNRVPYVFLLFGGIYMVMQVIGCLLVTNPPKEIVARGQTESSLSPSQVLKTKEFHMLWFTILFNLQAVTFFNSIYKTFGEMFIKDDQFLALVGSACAVSNTIGRVFWGWLVDRYHYKKCMLCLCAYVILFLLTMQFTTTLNKYVFAVWAFLLFFGLSGTYVLVPTCICDTFGAKHAGTIYGMVFANSVLGGPLTAVTTEYLSAIIGMNGLFYLIAGESFISLIITAVFQQRKIVMD